MRACRKALAMLTGLEEYQLYSHATHVAGAEGDDDDEEEGGGVRGRTLAFDHDGEQIEADDDDEAEAGEDVPDIRGIRDNVYQLRVTAAQKDTPTIYRRLCTCWCARCAAGDYENCVTDAAWSFVDLTPKP